MKKKYIVKLEFHYDEEDDVNSREEAINKAIDEIDNQIPAAFDYDVEVVEEGKINNCNCSCEKKAMKKEDFFKMISDIEDYVIGMTCGCWWGESTPEKVKEKFEKGEYGISSIASSFIKLK